MEELKIYKGRGKAEMRDEFLDFINLVFGFNGNDKDFLKTPPSCTKRSMPPAKTIMWSRKTEG